MIGELAMIAELAMRHALCWMVIDLSSLSVTTVVVPPACHPNHPNHPNQPKLPPPGCLTQDYAAVPAGRQVDGSPLVELPRGG